MSILSLLAKLNLNKSGFDAGLDNATHKVTHFGEHLKSHLGAAFGATAMIAAIEHTIEWGNEIDKIAQKLGITAKAAQELGFAAKLAGGNESDIGAIFFKLSEAMSKAVKSGNLGPFAAFNKGLHELVESDASEQISKMGEAWEDHAKRAEMVSAIYAIFGKRASEVATILGRLHEAKHGVLFASDEDIQRLAKAHEVQSKLGQSLKAIWSKFGTTDAQSARAFVKAMGITPPETQEDKHRREIKESNKVFLEKELNDKQAEDAAKAWMAIQDRIVERDKAIALLQRQISQEGMSDEEKRNALLEEREAIMRRIGEIEAPGKAAQPEERQKAILDLLKNQLEIMKLIDMPKAASNPLARHFQVEQTSLGSIGGGLGTNQAQRSADEQLRYIKEIKEILGRRGIVIATNGWK